MSRPFAYIGFACLLGLLVAFNSNIILIVVLIFLASIIFIALLIKKIKLAPTKLSLLGFVIGLTAFLIANALLIKPYDKYAENTYNISAVVEELTYESYGKYYYKVEVFEIDEESVAPFYVNLSTGFPLTVNDYDIIKAEVEFEKLADKINKFSNFSAYATDIRLDADLGYGGYSIIASNEKPLSYYIKDIRKAVSDKIDLHFWGDYADIISALILGDRYRIDDDIYNNFTLSGVNHILVVSGMHLSVVMGFIFFIFKKVKVNKKVIYFAVIPVLLLYMLISGLGLSVIRSGVMMIILILAELLGEEADSINSLGFAVVLICLINPFSAADFGFLLSVSATAGIILFAKPMANDILSKVNGVRFYRVINNITLAVTVSVSAFLFVMPILLYMYGTVNPVGIITATLLTLPATVLLILSFVCVVFSFLPIVNGLVLPISIAVNLLIKLMLSVTEYMSKYGDLLPKLPENRDLFLFIGFIISIGILFLFVPTKRLKVIALLSLAFMFIGVYIVSFYSMHNKLRMVVADVGYDNFSFIFKADEAVIISAEGYNVYLAENLLKEYGIREVSFVSENHTDLSIGLSEEYEVNLIDDDFTFANAKIDVSLNSQVVEIEVEDKTIVFDKFGVTSKIIDCDIGIASSSNTMFNADTIIVNYETLSQYKYSGTYININSKAVCFDLEDEFIARRIY